MNLLYYLFIYVFAYLFIHLYTFEHTLFNSFTHEIQRVMKASSVVYLRTQGPRVQRGRGGVGGGGLA